MRPSKIWTTDVWLSAETSIETSHGLPHQALRPLIDGFYNPIRRYERADASLTPKTVAFRALHQHEMPSPDFFHTDGPVPVVSERLRRIMCQFSLGSTLFHETRFVYRDGETPAKGNPFHYLNVTETKPGSFLPEKSKHVRQSRFNKDRWQTSDCSNLAVRSSALGGVDLWADPALGSVLFLSCDLAEAMIDAGIGPARLYPCRVVD